MNSEFETAKPSVVEIKIGGGEPISIVSFTELIQNPEGDASGVFLRRNLSRAEIDEARVALEDLPFEFRNAKKHAAGKSDPHTAEATIFAYRDAASNGGDKYNLTLKFQSGRRPMVDSGQFVISEHGAHIMKYTPGKPISIAGRDISTGTLVFPRT